MEAGAGDISRRFETPRGRPSYGIKWEEPTGAELQRWEGIWQPVVVGGPREVPAGVIAPVVPFRWARVRALGGGEDVAEVDEFGYREAESRRCLSVSDREVEDRIATAVESFYLSTENHGYVFDYRDGSRMHGDVLETMSAGELERMRVAEECHCELMVFIRDVERARDERMYALWSAHEESDLFGYRFDHRDGSLVHYSVYQTYSGEEKEDMDEAEDEFFDRLQADGGAGHNVHIRKHLQGGVIICSIKL